MALLASTGLEDADQWSSSLGFGLGLAIALLSLAKWLNTAGTASRAVTPAQIEAAVVALAEAQAEQWRTEAAAREMPNPWPLPVRFEVSDRARAVMTTWAAIVGRPDADPIPLAGEHGQLADLFTGPESVRRLVILGAPGSGKSMLALQLTLQLLGDRERRRQTATGPDREPVPVLLSLAGWDPAQPLDNWIALRLADDNEALARTIEGPDGSRRSLAEELVLGGRILPVLDGFDELGAEHGDALRAIGTVVDRGRQLVMTCRTDVYEEVVKSTTTLSRTPVVELQELNSTDVVQYLVSGTDDPVPRWDRVVKHLTDDKTSPLAVALSTPLTVWLARNVYRQRATDPDELRTADWAATRDGIEERLLDQLIPAVYTASVGGCAARDQPSADEARQWLTVLARQLHDRGTYDLAWWRLEVGVSTRQFTVVAMTAFGLLGGLTIGVPYGLSSAWVGALAGALIVGGSRGRPPRRALSRRLDPLGLKMGLIMGFSIGFAMGVFRGIGLALGVVLAVGFGLWLGLIHQHGDEQRAVSPTALLSRDRLASLAGAAAFALLWATMFAAASAEWWAGPVVWATIMPAFAFNSAWGRFGLARLMLAARRRAPIRLVRFLREAHDRGVLRQCGGVYQFRHNRLQESLADATNQRRSSG
ncbi:hypothetical protein GCM10010172_72700 [Paractinoplanes ferrugineus]|uniref:NACHT domain-containing protein n=1 Tax=Paractinoplanes ferrugineus TaxID=113564 RepID=A0A919IZA1_9ACTN|nr:hypothetical protein [Actinoplanes ferrugineus]GIE11575.1 hypothetical protein Afe05nite_34150 [Actinoplanes ferrugineus]